MTLLHFDYSGGMAVKFFFLLSGILVANSLIEKPFFFQYLTLRVFRLFPALVVCLFVTTFVVGPVLSTSTVATYFGDPAVYVYALRNLALSPQWELPGVFKQNPSNVVNGSLWTLPVEFFCYLMLGVVGGLGLLRNKFFAGFVFFALAAFLTYRPTAMQWFSLPTEAWMFPLFFCMGGLLAVLKEYVWINFQTVFCLFLAAALMHATPLYPALMSLAIFICALYFVSFKVVREIKLPGDFSYGIYLYGFVCQQVFKSIWPEQGVHWNQFGGVVFATILAVFSWYCIEAPSMRAGRRFAANLGGGRAVDQVRSLYLFVSLPKTRLNKVQYLQRIVVVIVIGALVLLAWVFYMQILRPNIAFMDSLRFLTYFDESERGISSVWASWNQGQHRGLLPQFVVYLNAKYFNYQIYGFALLSGAVLAVSYLVVLFEFRRELGAGRLEYVGVFGCLAIALFSFSNWELYSLDLGPALFLKNLAFVVYWICMAKVIAGNQSRFCNLVTIMGGPLVVLLVAYGWALPFVVACFLAAGAVGGWHGIRRNRQVWIPLALLVASLVLYVIGGSIFPPAPRSLPQGDASVANFLWSIPLALSSIFVGHESSAINGFIGLIRWGGVACCVVCIFFIVRDLRAPEGLHARFFFPLALLFYALVDLLLMAVTRGRFEPAATMVSRYFSDFCYVLVGIIFYEYLKGSSRVCGGASLPARRPMLRVAPVWGMAIFFIIGQVWTGVDEWRKAPYRHAAFDAMGQATIRAAEGARDIKVLQAPIDVAIAGARVQRDYGFGVFADAACTYKPDSDGWIGSSYQFLLKNCGEAPRFQFYLPQNFPDRRIVIAIDGRARDYVLRAGEVTTLSVLADVEGTHAVQIKIPITSRAADIDPSASDVRELGAIFSFASTQ
ncbi:peptidoglycan/LPS O-acetylase OafA/YrhL [Pseudorhodoferax soli]|uniref:Peptidoglycan/LPS O-acetylase OafA/YrhL n=2 Tax=Pseudorhodoferax soli TaxID=545864 RepID=A0A368XHP4_9BURK|nr:peptidoglycan/LPS O-acetylase OafA/YrhL [Pseudorhodoferax soli]